MQELNSLRNHLLIAMPGLDGSWFGGTVTYLCEHNADGAMGLVLNKPSGFEFSDICELLSIIIPISKNNRLNYKNNYTDN